MKVAGLIAAAVLLTSSTAASQPQTLWTDAVPPPRFQGPATVTAVFLPPEDIARYCNRPDKPRNIMIMACTFNTPQGTPVVLLPLPCRAAAEEYYARLTCHELAHVRGWPANHGN